MACPYHSEAAELQVPPDGEMGEGWIGWLDGCCGLPAWICPEGELHPVDAAFCTHHGCPRPPWSRVVDGGERAAVPLLRRSLEQLPARDGRSTPALAGNVLAYLTDLGTLVVADFRDAQVPRVLASGLISATLHVEGGALLAVIGTAAGLRYVAWPIHSLRRTVQGGGPAPAPVPVDPRRVHPLSLPRDRSRIHHGLGALRLVVEHDPVTGTLAETYRNSVGHEPGAYLVRRPTSGTPFRHLRPQVLYQVPVPVPGGTLVLGRIRWFGETVEGALLVPTYGPGGLHA